MPSNGGVFRIYNYPEDDTLFAVTTSGAFIFINPDDLKYAPWNHPEKPYLTDGSLNSNYMAATDDQGNLHIIDRTTEQFTKTRAHRLRKVGDLECPAWSCAWLNKNSVLSGGDDGRLCLWDFRESNLNESLHINGVTDEGIVFVKKKTDNVIVTGDYGSNYCYYDIRAPTRKLMGAKEVNFVFISLIT